MSSVAVRIPRDVHRGIQQQAKDRGVTVGSIIAEWFEEHEEQAFWARARASVDRLKSDETAWEELREEQRVYDGSLLDGLE